MAQSDSHIKRPFIFILAFFIVTTVLKDIEFLLIRTDETVLGDCFINKLIGIILIAIALRYLKLSFVDIGMDFSRFLKPLLIGLGMGVVSFSIAYGVECAILSAQGLEPTLEFYVGGFSLTGDDLHNTGAVFFLMCILFNFINVFMEEGAFRGLFYDIAITKYSYRTTLLIVALLFGVWHFITPIRSYIDGQMSFSMMLLMGIGYVFLAGLMSIKWSWLRTLSGVLWIGLGEHFFNNTIGNVLHVVTTDGTDQMQIVRILIAQLLTFFAVMIVFKRYKKNKQNSPVSN